MICIENDGKYFGVIILIEKRKRFEHFETIMYVF